MNWESKDSPSSFTGRNAYVFKTTAHQNILVYQNYMLQINHTCNLYIPLSHHGELHHFHHEL